MLNNLFKWVAGMSVIDSRSKDEILTDELWQSLTESGELDRLVLEKMKKKKRRDFAFVITDEDGNPVQDLEIVEEVNRVNNEFKKLVDKAFPS